MEGFEIKVPISLKSGNEGEKAGKQIGEKIAEHIKKAFKTIGITKGEKSEGSNLGGFIKGLKGVSAKLSVIAGIAAVTLGVLRASSPYLKGVLSIFGRAFTIFFRPFGDFLATMLRPLAMWLMKMAVAFLKWTRTTPGKTGVATATGAGAGALVGGAIGSVVPGLGTILGAGVGAGIGALLGLLSQIDWTALGQKISEFAGWVWSNLTSIWEWSYDYGTWIWTNITSIWNYAFDFGSWLWGKLTTIWNYIKDFGLWIWDKLKTIWNYAFDFGSWLWEKITSIWSWTYNFGAWLWDKITSVISGMMGFGNRKGSYATGTNFIPETGLYQLHRGEQVVNRNNNSKSSVVLSPTFQITGGATKDIDMDAIVRRAGRLTEMELKKRGII